MSIEADGGHPTADAATGRPEIDARDASMTTRTARTAANKRRTTRMDRPPGGVGCGATAAGTVYRAPLHTGFTPAPPSLHRAFTATLLRPPTPAEPSRTPAGPRLPGRSNPRRGALDYDGRAVPPRPQGARGARTRPARRPVPSIGTRRQRGAREANRPSRGTPPAPRRARGARRRCRRAGNGRTRAHNSVRDRATADPGPARLACTADGDCPAGIPRRVSVGAPAGQHPGRSGRRAVGAADDPTPVDPVPARHRVGRRCARAVARRLPDPRVPRSDVRLPAAADRAVPGRAPRTARRLVVRVAGRTARGRDVRAAGGDDARHVTRRRADDHARRPRSVHPLRARDEPDVRGRDRCVRRLLPAGPMAPAGPAACAPPPPPAGPPLPPPTPPRPPPGPPPPP